MLESDLDLVSDNSIFSSKGICSKVNRYLGREVVLLILQTALLVMASLSFLSSLSGSSTIKGGFGSVFDLVCLLEARMYTP